MAGGTALLETLETWKTTMTKTTMTISEPKQGVPIPTRYRRQTELTNAVSKLKIGESIEIDPYNHSCQVSVCTWAKRRGMTITTRKQENGKLGIWRIE